MSITRFETLALVTIAAGSAVLRLSPEQAMKRAYAVRRIEGTRSDYELRQDVQFKKGERFGYDGEPSKSLAANLRNLDEITKATDDDAVAVPVAQAAPSGKARRA